MQEGSEPDNDKFHQLYDNNEESSEMYDMYQQDGDPEAEHEMTECAMTPQAMQDSQP